MFDWFKRIRNGARKLTLPTREARAARNTEAIDLRSYTPEPNVFLGQLAYLQLSQFEILTNELKFSPKREYRAELSAVTAQSFEKYRVISKKLAGLGIDTADAMDSFVERIQTFHARTAGNSWHENIIKIYLTFGLLDDFYCRLAIGLDGSLWVDIEKTLSDKKFEVFAKRVLLESMASDPTLASSLALWGRRLMGDVLLELRSAFDNRKLAGFSKNKTLTASEERELNLAAYSKIEPLISELIGAHTVRMDALGLTA